MTDDPTVRTQEHATGTALLVVCMVVSVVLALGNIVAARAAWRFAAGAAFSGMAGVICFFAVLKRLER